MSKECKKAGLWEAQHRQCKQEIIQSFPQLRALQVVGRLSYKGRGLNKAGRLREATQAFD